MLQASVLSVAMVATASIPTAALATPSEAAQTGAKQPARGVIVMLRNQHQNLSITRSASSPRALAAKADQAPLIAQAKKDGVTGLRGFTSVNAFAATATPAQVATLTADPAVAAVYPDLPITQTASTVEAAAKAAGGTSTSAAATIPAGICPTDPAKPLLEPEALQTTHTAYSNPATAQAQSLVTGAGVKVAFLADGVDTTDPDFIRADGTPVFVDYQDFTGEGKDAPSDAAEAFGDASSIAAQGRQVYDLSDYVNPAHPLPTGCTITVRGIAPGASLVGLKVFGSAPTAPTSRFIGALDYAVNVAGVDVINESFGGNPFNDLGNDPISLADDAAVDAGVTVVASSGDAGTTGTIGSPASSSKVIGVAATTTFRSYQQEGYAGVGFSNGTWADGNISGLSSGGTTQQGRVPDLAAPGDLGWALCSENTDVYEGCTNDKSEPSPIINFGGTSQSSPFTAGGAALVIEAYKKTHKGVRPAPSLVKRFLTSTATDLGHPAYEQGAGQLNTLAAVQAAESYKDTHGSPKAVGTSLVVNKTQLAVAGQPGKTVKSTLSVTNVSGSTRKVAVSTRTLGKTLADTKGSVSLNTATAPTFLDSLGTVRSYVKKTFAVKSGASRLDVSMALAAPDGYAARIILIDPKGTYRAFSIPQGVGNYGHVDVRYPIAGTWSAYFALSKASAFNGKIQYEVKTSKFTTFGSVSPTSVTLKAGETKTVTVSTKLPKNPGDVSASVQLSGAAVTSVPLTARTLIPTTAKSNSFTGVLTGGNGRGTLGSSDAYYIDVPKGKKDLGISLKLADPGVVYFGVLTAPDGQVYSFQSNEYYNAAGNPAITPSLQIYRRSPQAGRWLLSLVFTNPISGLATQQKFTGSLAFNTVSVTATTLPTTKTKLKAGVAKTITVKVKNTGAAPLEYFADGRLSKTGDIALAELAPDSSTDIPLPVPAGINPEYLVPTQTSQVTFTATGTTPVNYDVAYNSGEPELYSSAVGNTATVKASAAQISPGLWFGDIGQPGPFATTAPVGTVSVTASVHGKLFDPALTSSTGDAWQTGVAPATNPALAAAVGTAGKTGPIARSGLVPAVKGTSTTAAAAAASGPLFLAPGKTGTITVTIKPSAAKGSVVQGHLYIDSFNEVSVSGDELIDLPYGYTVS
jgi:hypothetical protein